MNKSGWLFLIVCLFFCLGAGTVLQVYQGGTGATTASGARTNLAALSMAPPYFTDGTNFYDWFGFQITKPPASLVWLSQTPSSVTLGTNGNELIATGGSCPSSTICFQSQSASTLVEAEWYSTGGGSATAFAGVWFYDSTNGVIYQLYKSTNMITYAQCTYTGSGNPSSCATGPVNEVLPATYGTGPGSYHLRWTISSSNLVGQMMIDGSTWITITTITAGSFGTLTKGGFFIQDGGSASTQQWSSLIHEKVA